MTLTNEEIMDLPNMDDSLMATKPIYSRQGSLKRHQQNGDDNDDNTINANATSCKRGRISVAGDTCVCCPVEKFGCLRNVPSNSLKEHYTSELHQASLAKAIRFYHEKQETLNGHMEDQSEMQETVGLLAEGVACLHDDSVRMGNEVTQLDRGLAVLQRNVQTLQSSAEESQQHVQGIQMNNSMLQTEIESLKESMTMQSTQLFSDGTFIWRISELSKKMEDAVSEKQSSIYSPPFCSSPTGYKMRLRLYLNGDGQARRTHMSIFFVLCRSDYDSILQWPFNYKITFCLLDQTGAKNHIIDSFTPDVKSNSFQRPRSDMNIASGIPKFCQIPVFQRHESSYVRDDCMFIRCIVDFAGMPKAMIPFMCSLNPGLPLKIKRDMCEEELQRQTQATTTTSENQQNTSQKMEEL